MTFRLRQIDHTAAGREIIRETNVDKTGLGIGRAAENDLHLADLAVEPFHATIVQTSDTQIRIKSVGDLGFGLDGATSTGASIDIRTGAELRFGNYHVAISQADDGAVLLTVRSVQAEGKAAGAGDSQHGFSLARTLPGKRAMAWIAAIAILAIFLAVPIATHLTRTPVKAELGKPGQVVGDGAWRTGDLSLAHHGLEDNCEACHVEPFEAVRDETCASCHSDAHDHAPAKRMTAARGKLPLGQTIQWSVAQVFGKPGPGACTDCHTEHEGAGPMEPTRQQFCTDCHGALDEALADTKLGNAADFGKAHPEFQAVVMQDPASKTTARIALDKRPQERSGLVFPHKLHLDPKGGPARMASRIGSEQGYGNALVCKDCHTPTEDGVRFKPVNMEQDCESCHSLAYDKVGATFRTLKHGDVAQLRADLLALDRRGSSPISVNRRRPGDYAPGRPYYQNFNRSSRSGSGLLSQAFTPDGMCGECHLPQRQADGSPGVMPVAFPTRYMVNGWFDHAPHRQEKCTSCHAAETSTKAEDLLLPDLKDCRTCHSGESDHKAAVPSSCAMCHSYHPTLEAPRQKKADKNNGIEARNRQRPD